MQKYSHKGDQILKSLDSANNFTNWMYEVVSKRLKGDILEVGSGFGTYSQKLVADKRFENSKFTLSDIDSGYVKSLRHKYKDNKNVQVVELDIESKKQKSNFEESYDSIFALNVFEHIGDDNNALRNAYSLLKKDGYLVLILPNYKFLFNTLDKSVNHHRRYNKNEILEKLKQTKFKLVELSYFNSVGVIGWFLNGNILKKDEIDSNTGFLLKIYDAIIPYWKYIERLFIKKICGLSLFVVLRKE